MEVISHSSVTLFEYCLLEARWIQGRVVRIVVDRGSNRRASAMILLTTEITNRSTEAVQYRRLAFIYIVMTAKCEWRQAHDNSALSG